MFYVLFVVILFREHLVAVDDAPKGCDVSEYGDDYHRHYKHPDVGKYTAENSTKSCYHNALWTLHKTHLALYV